MGLPSVARSAAPTGGVAALPWNQRQLSPGIGGRFTMESVAAFVWNRWQLCRGISGRIHLESVAALPWNTHSIEGIFGVSPSGKGNVSKVVEGV